MKSYNNTSLKCSDMNNFCSNLSIWTMIQVNQPVGIAGNLVRNKSNLGRNDEIVTLKGRKVASFEIRLDH